MFERLRGAPAVVVSLHTSIEISCRTYIEAVVGTAKDIDVEWLRHSTRFLVYSARRWPACPETAQGAMSERVFVPASRLKSLNLFAPRLAWGTIRLDFCFIRLGGGLPALR